MTEPKHLTRAPQLSRARDLKEEQKVVGADEGRARAHIWSVTRRSRRSATVWDARDTRAAGFPALRDVSIFPMLTNTECFAQRGVCCVSSSFFKPQAMVDLGVGCHARIELPGTWGMSNSGIVESEGEILVVDTRNDVPRAARLRADALSLAPDARITTVVNTHADGDHWYGNFVFEDATIIATRAAAQGMREIEMDPRELAEMGKPGSAFRRWTRWRSEFYDYEGWRPVYPTTTFEGRHDLVVGRLDVELIQVGPAHTLGDAIVHVPEAGVVFAGDIIFNGATPMVWSGPVSRLVAALELILGLGSDVVVSGHGPIASPSDVRLSRDYLAEVLTYTVAAFEAGVSLEESYARFESSAAYRHWPHFSRVFQTMSVIYAELDPDHPRKTRRENLDRMLADDGWMSKETTSG